MWTFISISSISATVAMMILIHNHIVIKKLKKRRSPHVYLQTDSLASRFVDDKINNKKVFNKWLLMFIFLDVALIIFYVHFHTI